MSRAKDRSYFSNDKTSTTETAISLIALPLNVFVLKSAEFIALFCTNLVDCTRDAGSCVASTPCFRAIHTTKEADKSTRIFDARLIPTNGFPAKTTPGEYHAPHRSFWQVRRPSNRWPQIGFQDPPTHRLQRCRKK